MLPQPYLQKMLSNFHQQCRKVQSNRPNNVHTYSNDMKNSIIYIFDIFSKGKITMLFELLGMIRLVRLADNSFDTMNQISSIFQRLCLDLDSIRYGRAERARFRYTDTNYINKNTHQPSIENIHIKTARVQWTIQLFLENLFRCSVVIFITNCDRAPYDSSP